MPTRHHLDCTTWAAECAERVLSFFELEEPDDFRPRNAIEAARMWRDGELAMSDARKAAFAAHKAARNTKKPEAVAAARSAGHAAATAHALGHAKHAATYAQKAIGAAGQNVEAEKQWQNARKFDLTNGRS
ncbi:MAG: putative immunity protein [Pseudomonadota bacterium]